ncbi:uncharacterized protein LOC133730996 [Rosa rugosa]|uniref:uncharacterized protein LOC133730996 n=1 Tax=Rosa rugosa TaxID=74645 RepID=UPI002B411F38|nr:uncharacterized protein LOC133730996 [Rosa rugosa]
MSIKSECKQKRPAMKWRCPPSGRLKIKIDGAFDAVTSNGGIGVVVRNEERLGVAAFARPFVHAHSALNMEVEACRVGLLLGIHQGWSEIEVESDSTLLIAALNREEQDFSEVGRVLEDCKDYMSAFQFIQVRHIYREANGVAHRLAHLARVGRLDDMWLGETPVII